MMAILVQSGDLGRKRAPPRLREDLRRRHQRAPAADEFRATLGALGIAQHRAAQLFVVGPRSVRRWQHGDRRVPCGVGIVLRLLAAGAVTVAQVEQAAVPVPARTNGSAKPEPPVPLLVEPAPEQSALAPAHANSSLTTAEKVYALAPKACRWPYGDPRHPDFHFCGNPVAEKPYCERHRALASRTAVPAISKGAHHAAPPVALSAPPAGAPNRRSVR